MTTIVGYLTLIKQFHSMAIIYTYHETQSLIGDDLLVVSKSDGSLVTNSITLSTLAKFLNSAPKMGNGTNSYVTQWADGPNGILEDSPAFTFDGGAGLKQFVLSDGYRYVVDRDAATTVGDPEYAITQNGVAKTSFGWDDDGGGFGFLYNWAGYGFKIGSTTLYPQFEILTDATIKNISNADFEFEADIIDIAGNVGNPGNVLSSLGTGNGVQWVDKGSGTTNYIPLFTNGPDGVIGDSIIKQNGVFEVEVEQSLLVDDAFEVMGEAIFNDDVTVTGATFSAGSLSARQDAIEITNQIDASDGKVFINGLPSFADDAAAGLGGIASSRLYQTDGSGAAPLDVAGIVMIKQ